ncbi:MAG: type II toxin-antitoxin system HicB family antitoxin, partial [Dehalococcoidia bacterium]|nr:type II toxin-antitoxin system HicB family antitoxin [Dehalococcoidia bacterium]
MIEYKGYIAKVEYDDSVDLLHASVVNSGPYPIANCEAEDVKTLRKEFRASIEEYLASCVEDGVQPRKPFSGNPNRPELHHRITVSAAEEGMSVNNRENAMTTETKTKAKAPVSPPPRLVDLENVSEDEPLFDDTDVPVQYLFKYLDETHNLYAFLDDFPQVSMDQ